MNIFAITDAQANAAAGGIIGGMFAVFMLAVIAIYILLIIAEWKIFTKAGEKGWKSLIPIYNMVVFFRIIGISPWWVLVMFVLTFIPTLTGTITANGNNTVVNTDNVIGNISLIALIFVSIFIGIYSSYRLAKSFDKGIGYTIGLILLPEIFYLILGFGSAKYNKKAALKD